MQAETAIKLLERALMFRWAERERENLGGR